MTNPNSAGAKDTTPILPNNSSENKKYTDEELIEKYNREVGITAWGKARVQYLYELAQELKSRKFNSDCLFPQGNFSIKEKVILKNNTLVHIKESKI